MRLPVLDVELASNASEETVAVATKPLPLQVRSHGRTDPGRVRKNNEDQFLIAELSRAVQTLQSSVAEPDVHLGDPRGYLFVVADGVGGHAGGAEASAIAVNTIENFALDALHWCASLPNGDSNQLLSDFQRALKRADAKLIEKARQQPELHGMGTTITMAYVADNELFVAHVGDSRCYILRDAMLYRLTRDHTLVDEMVRRGYMKAEEAAGHAYRHVITNVVGGKDAGIKVELHRMQLQPGDCLLLCSDGLTEMVTDAEISAIVENEVDPKAACDQLIDLANDHGGKDNVSAIVARFH